MGRWLGTIAGAVAGDDRRPPWDCQMAHQELTIRLPDLPQLTLSVVDASVCTMLVSSPESSSAMGVTATTAEHLGQLAEGAAPPVISVVDAKCVSIMS